MACDPPIPYEPDDSVLKPLSPLADAITHASFADVCLFVVALSRAARTPPDTPEPHRATPSVPVS